MTLSIRAAHAGDLDILCGMAKTFIEETDHDVEYSGTNARQFLWTYIVQPTTDILLAVDETIIGASLLVSSLEFQRDPFCYLGKFYITQEGRRTRAGRELLEASIEWGRAMGCNKMFSTATAGLSEREQRLFIALMKRAGFVDSGPCLELTL